MVFISPFSRKSGEDIKIVCDTPDKLRSCTWRRGFCTCM